MQYDEELFLVGGFADILMFSLSAPAMHQRRTVSDDGNPKQTSPALRDHCASS